MMLIDGRGFSEMNSIPEPALTDAHKRAMYRSAELKELLKSTELRRQIESVLSLKRDHDREGRLEVLQRSALFRKFHCLLLETLLSDKPKQGLYW